MTLITLSLALKLKTNEHFMSFLSTKNSNLSIGEVFDEYEKTYPNEANEILDSPTPEFPKTKFLEKIENRKTLDNSVIPTPVGFKLSTEGVLNVDRTEDGGCALISESFQFNTLNSDEDNGMFINIYSWDDDMLHTDMKQFIGKNVRITIEVIV
jgi:hypothetical protein